MSSGSPPSSTRLAIGTGPTAASGPSASGPGADGASGLPNVGDVVDGKYKIERVLGTGGMGIVVEARHTLLGELVAIKFLRAGADQNSDYAQRFLREAKATLRIKSEHVVRVHDMGITAQGHAFLVMEHLDGDDLANFLHSRGPLPVAEAVDLVLQACQGLAEAHAQGVVHRDLKPANLFLVKRADGSPLVKILDFGIAKARTTENITITDTSAVFGSPAYMPPEQIRSAKSADARSDVWSIGVVLFELLTQTLPFNGESGAAVLASIVADAPRALRSVRADVPSGLVAAINRCLEKDPDKRFPSVYELASALLPFAGDPGATTGVERMRRLVNSSPRVPRPSVPPSDSSPRLPPTGIHATTAHALVAPNAKSPGRSRRIALGAALALAVAAGSGFVAARKTASTSQASSDPASASGTSLAAAPTAERAADPAASHTAAPAAAAPGAASAPTPPTSATPSANVAVRAPAPSRHGAARGPSRGISPGSTAPPAPAPATSVSAAPAVTKEPPPPTSSPDLPFDKRN